MIICIHFFSVQVLYSICVKPWPNVPVISVLKPTGSPLWKLWRRLHNQPVTFTTWNPSDSYLAVVSRSSKSLDKIDLLMQTWWSIDWILRLLATLMISWGHSYGRFFEQAAINICSGSIPKREFTKPAANRQTDSPKHRTPQSTLGYLFQNLLPGTLHPGPLKSHRSHR